MKVTFHTEAELDRYIKNHIGYEAEQTIKKLEKALAHKETLHRQQGNRARADASKQSVQIKANEDRIAKLNAEVELLRVHIRGISDFVDGIRKEYDMPEIIGPEFFAHKYRDTVNRLSSIIKDRKE